MSVLYCLFNGEDLDYRIIYEGPQSFILLKDEEYDHAVLAMQKAGFHETVYNYSCEKGYIYKYAMREPMAFIIENNSYVLFTKIPCHSLTQNCIIPMDKEIQHYAWCNKIIKNSRVYTNEIVVYINRITECVFRKRCFEIADKTYFADNKIILKRPVLRDLLLTIFYSYTDQLLQYLEKSEYDVIFSNYLKWKGY